MLRVYQLLVFVPMINNSPSAHCAYAANFMGKDLDILAIGAVPLNHILFFYLNLLITFKALVHNPNAPVLCSS
jgi:hypothetical protein